VVSVVVLLVEDRIVDPATPFIKTDVVYATCGMSRGEIVAGTCAALTWRRPLRPDWRNEGRESETCSHYPWYEQDEQAGRWYKYAARSPWFCLVCPSLATG
jgi:hypothetical protein